MARWTVTRVGIEGPGKGGQFTYATAAATEQEAIDKTWAKSQLLLHRLNRQGTLLDPTPINITRIR